MSRGVRIIVLVAPLVLLALFALGGSPFLLEAFLSLLVGWFSFLRSTIPNVCVHWGGVSTALACLILTILFAHGFLGWLWRSHGNQESWQPRWTLSAVAVVLLMFMAGMAFTGIAHQLGWLISSPVPLTRSNAGILNERNAFMSLKVILQAQEAFRREDVTASGKHSYWREDIAGLYGLQGRDGQPIKLISLSLAEADDHPITSLSPHGPPSPVEGYRYRSLSFQNETTPLFNHFAACAYPASLSVSNRIYIISDQGDIFRKAVTRIEPPKVFPDHPEEEGWQKMD